jgi:hypothetical protein
MRHPHLQIVTCLTLATTGIAACAHSLSAPTDVIQRASIGADSSGKVPGSSPDLSNTWGGEHLVLVVRDTAVTLQYDCAHGTMSIAPKADATGRFAVAGTHVFEHGGPVRADELEDRRAAEYDGRIVGSTMTLSVRVNGVSTTLGPFSLKRGDAGRLNRCY